MKPETNTTHYPFLSKGGEMGSLMRAKNWDKTIVGTPETWPQSLRTTLSILLNSKFPMFLFWGPDLVCFYNDAYRPSLGQNGKHPDMLGASGKEAWPEIWDTIKPLIDQVLSGGEATWHEDQLIPIYRNGHLEDVYWTFSYSPVHDEVGHVAGVLVTCSETTDKVNTLKYLEKSNRSFYNNIMQAPVAMCVFKSKDHVVETANDLMLEIWGKTPDEVLGKPIFEGLPEARGQGLEPLLDNVYTTGEKFSASERPVNLPRRNRIETTFINFVYEALREPDGTIYGIVAIASEVTPQVIARSKIEESEEKLNIIIEASELGTWELNLKTKEFNYSERYSGILGYTGNIKASHEEMKKHLHPDDLTGREEAFKNAYKTGVLHYETRLIWNDQSLHWVQSKGKVIYDKDGLPVKMIGTIRDITTEKLHQQDLEEREQKFRLLADSMPQFIWTGDAEGNLNYFNQSVYNYSGLSVEQIDKEGWLQIVHPDEREENIKTWLHSIRTGTDFLFEHRFRRYDGEYRWQLSRAIPQKDITGKIQMWVGTSTDIHDQKAFVNELEKLVKERTHELELKNRDLEKMNDELQSFAYVSSHDLQEPLRKIQAFANRILDKENEQLSETGKDYFRRMQEAAARMQTLIQDLLAYSRTSTSDRIFEDTDLNSIIEEVKAELKETLAEKNAEIETDINTRLKLIPFQFRQLLNNLIGNALKFSKPGVPPHICISADILKEDVIENGLSIKKSYCHIQFTDNGIGFDPQYKERIFEIFQRLHGKSEYSGTGIGLAIVKKIIENHQGYIEASGEPGKGARFDMYIPLTAPKPV